MVAVKANCQTMPSSLFTVSWWCFQTWNMKAMKNENLHFPHFPSPPPPLPTADNVSQRQKESILSLDSEVRRYSHRGSEFRQRGYIYNGGSVVLKCSANYHLCIFSHGLRGLWVLWAVCQRWNRKEKCSLKRMRQPRAPDLRNTLWQMKCTLPPQFILTSCV